MKLKKLKLKCSCGFRCHNGKVALTVFNMADGDIEIDGVFLDKKSVKKLIFFLNDKRKRKT